VVGGQRSEVRGQRLPVADRSSPARGADVPFDRLDVGGVVAGELLAVGAEAGEVGLDVGGVDRGAEVGRVLALGAGGWSPAHENTLAGPVRRGGGR
jgi:hypothetical protein